VHLRYCSGNVGLCKLEICCPLPRSAVRGGSVPARELRALDDSAFSGSPPERPIGLPRLAAHVSCTLHRSINVRVVYIAWETGITPIPLPSALAVPSPALASLVCIKTHRLMGCVADQVTEKRLCNRWWGCKAVTRTGVRRKAMVLMGHNTPPSQL
jgi:hypothetical protein